MIQVPEWVENLIGREAAGQGASAWSIEQAGETNTQGHVYRRRILFHAAAADQLGFAHDASPTHCGWLEGTSEKGVFKVTFVHGGYDASRAHSAPRVSR